MNSWAKVPLQRLGEIVSGSTPSTYNKEYWDGSIPWITPADLTSHTGIYFKGELRKITQAGYKSCSTKMLPPGSILFSSRAPIGHCAVTAFPLCTNQGFKSIIPNAKLNPIFGFFALKYFTPELISRGRGATFAEINKELFGDFEIPLPPLPEQERIAAILDKADRLRCLRRYALELGDSYLQSVFLEMFGDPVTNPHGWKRGKIGDVVTFSQYGTSTKSNDYQQGYPILGMGSITYTGEIDLSSISYVDLDEYEFQALRLVPGDIIFNRTNSTELVGKTAYWDLDFDAVIASYLVKLRLCKEVLPEYFTALLNSTHYKNLFQLRCRKAVGQSNISPTYLKEFPIIIPPVALQEKYAVIVRRHKRLQSQQRESLRQVENLFQSLLKSAFDGGV